MKMATICLSQSPEGSIYMELINEELFPDWVQSQSPEGSIYMESETGKALNPKNVTSQSPEGSIYME